MHKDSTNTEQLNLPAYPVQLERIGGKTHIWDSIRQRYVVLTPEEWVRQHYVHYMIDWLHYPEITFSLEGQVKGDYTAQRTDLMIRGIGAVPWVIVEFKAPQLALAESMWQQLYRYNLMYRASHLVLTNGIEQLVCCINYQKGSYQFLPQLPTFEELKMWHQSLS